MMNKKTMFYAIGLLCMLAALAMYVIGKNSGHLSELKDFFWVPIPLGIILLITASKRN
jgi:uncharacterized membrane protein